jgi:Clp amino terminal domain, pathogenicity island component
MAQHVTVSDLVDEVYARTGGSDELGRVDAALEVSRELEAAADAVVDHFVGEARVADCSWTAIAERMGVSKQAARARFAHRVERISWGGIWVAPRLAACLDRAGVEARDGDQNEVGTEHLLIGLMEDGLGAATLERLGVSATAIREAVDRLFGRRRPRHADNPLPAQPAMPSAEMPLSADATDAMTGALALSRSDSCQVVRTEHLLFVLATDPGGRARRVLNALQVDVADVKRELAQCLPRTTGRRRRLGRKVKAREV